MKQKTYATPLGNIVYWTSLLQPALPTLVFLPGLTADHRLFDKQLEYFSDRFNMLVWDAPGHSASSPFELSFSLADKAGWLYEILRQESVSKPILIGQSMGGYVSQAFLQRYPRAASAFISIDSAPLGRQYTSTLTIRLLKHTEPMYRLYPWRLLLRDGSAGCAETGYGRELMRTMMAECPGGKDGYCRLAGFGYRLLAEAIEADLPYAVTCPALLLCGEQDKAGLTRRYNRRWAENTGLPLKMIPGAGHNSNTDQPELVNRLIEDFLSGQGLLPGRS